MRSNLVVIRLPFVGSAASLEDRREPVHVEELVANLAVERFDTCVLRRFAGRDEVQLDISLSCPAQHRMAGKLGAVIKANRLGKVALERDPLELADDIGASLRVIDVQRQALSGEVVDDRQGPNRTAVFNAIVREVDRPSLIGPAHRLDEVAANVVYLTLAAWPDLQLQSPIDPAKSRLANDDLVSADHDKQPAPSPAWPLGGQRLESRCDRLVVDRRTVIVEIAEVVTDQRPKPVGHSSEIHPYHVPGLRLQVQ